MTKNIADCIGHFPHAMPPNACETCKIRETCKRVVAKERLREIMERIDRIEAIVHE